MIKLRKSYLLFILAMIAASVTTLSAQTVSRHPSSKPPTKVKTNPPEPLMYVTCSFCAGFGTKNRYNDHTKRYNRVKCTACSGTGKRGG
jgi:hypothetical protein